MTINVFLNSKDFMECQSSRVFIALNLFSLSKIRDFEQPCAAFWVDGIVGAWFLSLKLQSTIDRNSGVLILEQLIRTRSIKKTIILGSFGKKFETFCKQNNIQVVEHHELKNYHENSAIQLKNSDQCDLVIISLPSPKQEMLAFRLSNAYPALKFICVGGAVAMIDHPDLRAPSWVSDMGLEWLYRLKSDTRRRLVRLIGSLTGFLLSVRYLSAASCMIKK